MSNCHFLFSLVVPLLLPSASFLRMRLPNFATMSSSSCSSPYTFNITLSKTLGHLTPYISSMGICQVPLATVLLIHSYICRSTSAQFFGFFMTVDGAEFWQFVHAPFTWFRLWMSDGCKSHTSTPWCCSCFRHDGDLNWFALSERITLFLSPL